MDGEVTIPWKEPRVNSRIDFLKKMQVMSTPKNFIQNLEKSSSEEGDEVDDYQKIEDFRKQGNLSGAFFLARQLAAVGEEKGKALVKEIMEEMNNG